MSSLPLPIRGFDAHIYFEAASRAEAEALRAKAEAEFAGRAVKIHRLIDRKVGPHPWPMFEMNFGIDLFGELVLWLMAHRGSLPVLVHRLTGDDLPDHYAGALWMGEKLALDNSRLDPPPVPPAPLG